MKPAIRANNKTMFPKSVLGVGTRGAGFCFAVARPSEKLGRRAGRGLGPRRSSLRKPGLAGAGAHSEKPPCFLHSLGEAGPCRLQGLQRGFCERGLAREPFGVRVSSHGQVASGEGAEPMALTGSLPCWVRPHAGGRWTRCCLLRDHLPGVSALLALLAVWGVLQDVTLLSGAAAVVAQGSGQHSCGECLPFEGAGK